MNDLRCTKPSTQISGGGYIEVCCMCDEHAARFTDFNPGWRPIRGSGLEDALKTAWGIKVNRARCQFVAQNEEDVP